MKIIHLPFDEERYSKKAYDITGNNRHATIKSGGYFTIGNIGNSFNNNGVGLVKVPMSALNVENDFTIMFFLKYGGSSKINFEYVLGTTINKIEIPLNTDWNHLVFQRNGSNYYIYLNFELLETIAPPAGYILEFGIYDEEPNVGVLPLTLDGNLSGEIAPCKFDDFIVFNEYVNINDIIELYTPKQVVIDYFINGINFKDFGVWVSNSSPMDSLEVKDGNDIDFENMNGFIPSLDRYKKEREVVLECFIVAKDNISLAITFKDFINELQKQYLNRLQINVIEHKPLIYDVYLKSNTELKKKWSQSTNEVYGTFTLKMVEPFSDKVVLAYYGEGSPRLVIRSNRLINIKGDEVGYIQDIDARNGYTLNPTFSDSNTKFITIQNLSDPNEIIYSDFAIIWRNL